MEHTAVSLESEPVFQVTPLSASSAIGSGEHLKSLGDGRFVGSTVAGLASAKRLNNRTAKFACCSSRQVAAPARGRIGQFLDRRAIDCANRAASISCRSPLSQVPHRGSASTRVGETQCVVRIVGVNSTPNPRQPGCGSRARP
jgi:hypothetical protein